MNNTKNKTDPDFYPLKKKLLNKSMIIYEKL